MAAMLAGYLGAAWFLPVMRLVRLVLFWIIVLLLGGAVPGGAAGADEYTLPLSDPCSSSLEAYKRAVGEKIDAYLQAFQYREFRSRIEQWSLCCPDLQREVERLRPANPDVPRKFNVKLEKFNLRGGCDRHVYYTEKPGWPAAETESLGKSWYQEYQRTRDAYWMGVYAELSERLHTCCMRQFTGCLKTVRKEGTTAEACAQSYFPELSPPAAGKDEQMASQKLAEERESSRQLLELLENCTSVLERKLRVEGELRDATARQKTDAAELRSCEGTKALGELEHAAERKDLTRRLRLLEQARDGLRAELAETVPRPGSDLLLAAPAGDIGTPLTLCTLAALLAGFLLGLPGRRGLRDKLLSGALSAVLSGLVLLGMITLLPDTRLPDLLLALSGAVLLMMLRTLLRAAVLFRQRRQAPLSP